MGAVACKETAPGFDLYGIPDELIVVSPNGQQTCAGRYLLVPDVIANGQPVWRKRSTNAVAGDRWLYSSNRGTWNIGGKKAMQREFQCHDAHIYRPALHKGRMPHEMGGPWQWTDGRAFHKDPDISIEEARLGDRSARGLEGRGWLAGLDIIGLCPVSVRSQNAEPVMLLSSGIPHKTATEDIGVYDESDDESPRAPAQSSMLLAAPARNRQKEKRSPSQHEQTSRSWQFEDTELIEEGTPVNYGVTQQGDAMTEGMVDPEELRRCLLRVVAERKGTSSWGVRRNPRPPRAQSPDELQDRRNRPSRREGEEQSVGPTPVPLFHDDDDEDGEGDTHPGSKQAALEITCMLSSRSKRPPVNFVFLSRPLGFEFESKAPLTIKTVSKACAASHPGMKAGMVISKIDGRDVTKMTCEDATVVIQKLASRLPNA